VLASCSEKTSASTLRNVGRALTYVRVWLRCVDKDSKMYKNPSGHEAVGDASLKVVASIPEWAGLNG